MKNYLHTSFIIIVISLFGCVPEPLSINGIPEAESRIVVSSAFIPEQSLAIFLTRNYSALIEDLEDDTSLIQDLLVRGAEVTLTSNGEMYVLNEIEAGLYAAEELIKNPGVNYQLTITDTTTAEKVTATTEMMPLVEFQNVEVKAYEINEEYFPNVLCSFVDPVGKNWYMINVQYFTQDQDPLRSFLDARVFNFLLTDEDNPGGLIEKDFVAFVGRDIDIGDSIVVSLTNISQAYYQFLDKRRNRSVAFDLVSEPFNLPTNVNNGYGFFNIHQQDLRIIRSQRD